MNIFNMTQGIELEELPTGVEESFGIFKNGVFKKTTNDVGTFTHKISDLPQSLPLTELGEVAFERNEEIPRIPYQIFQAMVKFFKDVMKDIKSEVYCIIVWDKVRKDFFLHVPVQQVSGATVKYENSKDIYANPDLLVYCDFHSHVNMAAFFSSVDTKDEVAGRYFGVLGKLSNERPQMALKASFATQSVTLSYSDLFDIEVEKLHEDSYYFLDYEVLKDRITEKVYQAPVNKFKGYNPYKPKTPTLPKPQVKPAASQIGSNFNNDYYSDLDYYDDYAVYDINGNVIDLETDYLTDVVEDNLIAEEDLKYNLTTDTVFFEDPEELEEFMYDFKMLFNADNMIEIGSSLRDITNIYASLTKLITSYHIVDPEIRDEVIEQIDSDYSKAMLDAKNKTEV